MSGLAQAYPPLPERVRPVLAEAATRAGWPLAGWSRKVHSPDAVAYIADGDGPALARPMVLVVVDDDHESVTVGAWTHVDRGGACAETLAGVAPRHAGCAIHLAMYVATGAHAAAAHLRACLAEA